MKALTILTYQWKDLIRGKWIIGYCLIYLLMTDALLRFGGGGTKALLSISNIMLLLVPLVSIVYGVLYLYQSREFIELLLAQPIRRSSLFWGLIGGIGIPLSAAFVFGAGFPFLYTGILLDAGLGSVVIILGLGLVLTVLFTGLGFLIGLHFYNERIKGLGLALVGWLFLAVVYDGLILLVVSVFGDYPLERIVLGISIVNPIDLARIAMLLKFDISAMMGYTGAVFNRFFGGEMGIITASAVLLIWVIIPIWRGARKFLQKDF